MMYKLYNAAFFLIIGAAIVAGGDSFINIALASSMVAAAGVCVLLAERRAK